MSVLYSKVSGDFRMKVRIKHHNGLEGFKRSSEGQRILSPKFQEISPSSSRVFTKWIPHYGLRYSLIESRAILSVVGRVRVSVLGFVKISHSNIYV